LAPQKQLSTLPIAAGTEPYLIRSGLEEQEKRPITQYYIESRNITYPQIIDKRKEKHQPKITERKEDPNPTATRKTQNNNIIQNP
jgi:hypothetical protein